MPSVSTPQQAGALDGLTMRFAEHVAALRYDDIPDDVAAKAKLILRDGLGNQIAASAPAKLHDPAILAFMRKIEVHEDPALTARMTASMGAAVPTRLTATLDDGRRMTREIDAVPGFAGMPTGRADVEAKFRGNVRDRWPAERIDAIVPALWRLDNVADISQLLAGVATQPAP
jgi:2-methylcitrate dehydratase PrpD